MVDDDFFWHTVTHIKMMSRKRDVCIERNVQGGCSVFRGLLVCGLVQTVRVRGFKEKTKTKRQRQKTKDKRQKTSDKDKDNDNHKDKDKDRGSSRKNVGNFNTMNIKFGIVGNDNLGGVGVGQCQNPSLPLTLT